MRIIISLFAFLMMCTCSFGQIVGGGGGENISPSGEKNTSPAKVLFYMKFGSTSAAGSFARHTYETGTVGGGITTTLGMFTQKELSVTGLKAGVEIQMFAFSINKANWIDYDYSYQQTASPYIFISGKIGPIVSYQLTEKLVVDYKLLFGLAYSDYPSFEDSDGYRIYGYGLGFRNLTGINVRYMLSRRFGLIAGIDFVFGKINYYIDYSNYNDSFSYSYNIKFKQPVNTIQYTIGITF